MVRCVKNSTSTDNVEKKRIRKNKSDLGEDFVAPDGGWGWIVCLAVGISNLVAFPVLQQFGLLLRERLIFLGLNNSQITTVINIHSALSACTGLLNGPMFRRFSYRQVAVAGAILMSSGLFLISFANSFLAYIATFSVLYGIGIGISMSSSGLALNTYFKEKRRMATGFSWTITALGPILMPYAVTNLLDFYGVQGSLMIFSAITMQSFICALIYQPVLWHVKKSPQKDIVNNADDQTCTVCRQEELPSCDNSKDKSVAWFSKSLENFGSKLSLQSRKSEPLHGNRNDERSEHFDAELLLQKPRTSSDSLNQNKSGEITKCSHRQECLEQLKNPEVQNESILQRIALFFDLDLLKDLRYVNLVVGLTLANFAESNFAILTPFILSDFGCSKEQAAFAMSLLAGTDISMRFLVPFFAERTGWENRTFYLIGVIGMAFGRIIIAHIHLYTVILVVFAWIGFNKGLRTVFMGLVIPSYVPLRRLPAASGLQLVFMGIFSFAFGPIVGLIRDATDYTFTLHCLNIATFVTAISWFIEKIIVHVLKTKSNRINNITQK